MFTTTKLIKQSFIYSIKNDLEWGGQLITDANDNNIVTPEELQKLEDRIRGLEWENEQLIKEIESIKNIFWENGINLNNPTNREYFEKLESDYQDAFLAIRDKYFIKRTEATWNTSTEQREFYEELRNPFSRNINLQNPPLEWEDINYLLRYLNSKWYNTWSLNWFWEQAKSALSEFQTDNMWDIKDQELVAWNGLGEMDFDSKTMKYIVKDINENGFNYESAIEYGIEASEVLASLKGLDSFLLSLSDAYGLPRGKTDHTSYRIMKSNLRRSFPGISNEDMVKAIRLIDSWKPSAWSAWPKVNKIVEIINWMPWNVKQMMKDMYMSEYTTAEWIKTILDVLNNPNMDTANLRRFTHEVYSSGVFSSMPDSVKDLIKDFQNSQTTEEAKNIVSKIYKISLEEYREIESENARHELWEEEIREGYIWYALSNINKKDPKENIWTITDWNNKSYNIVLGRSIWGTAYLEIAWFKWFNPKVDIMEVDSLRSKSPEEQERLVREWISKIRTSQYEKREEEISKYREALASIWEIASRYVNLDAKFDQIKGSNFDLQWTINRERAIDKEISSNDQFDANSLSQLDSSQINSLQGSYWPEIDMDKLWDKTYMQNYLEKMSSETINWHSSILAGVIRGIEQHYGITFSVTKFKKAFLKASAVEQGEMPMVLSTTSKNENQQFEWEIWEGASLFKININWTDVYFRDKLTSIVTKVNDIPTTVSTTSLPNSAFPNAYPSGWNWDWDWGWSSSSWPGGSAWVESGSWSWTWWDK